VWSYSRACAPRGSAGGSGVPIWGTFPTVVTRGAGVADCRGWNGGRHESDPRNEESPRFPAAAGKGWRTTNSRPTDLTFKALPAVFLLKHHPFEMRCPAPTEKPKACKAGSFGFPRFRFDAENSPVVHT
jgi:hypothetical protein